MKLPTRHSPADRRRGAALLLSVLVLFVLITIVFQISIGTMTDARVGRNDVGLTQIDHAISSARYDVIELLEGDADASGEGAGEGDSTMATSGGAAGGGGEEGGEESAPCDSRRDEWAMPQRTEINGIQLRILIEAENAKYNILNMLVEDEEEAEEAFQRVARIIDRYREGTDDDLSMRDGEEMARAMKEFMLERGSSDWEKPKLLTEDDEREGLVLPQSLREFLVLDPFEEYHFRCYRDSKDTRVHSLDQFLTVWSSPGTAADLPTYGEEGGAQRAANNPDGSSEDPGAGEEGGSADAGAGESGSGGEGDSGDSGEPTGTTNRGYGVNINLAPAAVLNSLVDDRDVRPRFWEDVIEYRNLEEEPETGASSYDTEPIYDEFGEEMVELRIFESLEELSEVRSWDSIDSEFQERVRSLLTTESEVFSIYLTARRNTATDDSYGLASTPEEQARMEEEPSGALVRTVRIVVWRRPGEDGASAVTIVPWEILTYAPFEIQDYPEDW
jgi:hypothetical protein